jgi:hypothetical protein
VLFEFKNETENNKRKKKKNEQQKQRDIFDSNLSFILIFHYNIFVLR